MSDYAQARWKDTKEPTIIRIMSHEGGMNPDFGLVDVIPDEDLNKRLQFYVSCILQKSRIVLNTKTCYLCTFEKFVLIYILVRAYHGETRATHYGSFQGGKVTRRCGNRTVRNQNKTMFWPKEKD